jgi:ferrous iron transport protein A
LCSWRRTLASDGQPPSCRWALSRREALSMTSLAQLSLGQSARVIQLSSSGEIAQRLLEMGVTPGVEIRFVSSAPLGDPMEYELRGYRLCMRRAEAEQIEVEAS